MRKIEQKEGYIIWAESMAEVKHEDIYLPENIKGVFVSDGVLVDTLSQNQKYKYKTPRKSTTNELILSSTDPVVLLWGVGNIPYQDLQARIPAKCGMSGEITLQVFNTRAAYKKLGKNITVEGLRDATINDARGVIEGIFKKFLEDGDMFGRPDFIGKKADLSNKIKRALDDFFASQGLVSKSVTITSFMVDEEYEAKRAEYDKRQEDKRRMREDLRTMEELRDVFGGDKPNVVIQEVVKCPKCGKKIADGERFCATCGTRIRK